MGARKYFIFAILLSGVLSVDSRSAFDEDLYQNVLNSEECSKQLQYIYTDPLYLTFIDASAKLPSGLLEGNINDLGDYYQCLSINEYREEMEIQGKYCMVKIPFNDISIPELPSWPPQIPWPPQLPGGNDNDNGESADAVQVAEQYDTIRNYVRHITGIGPQPESRIFPSLVSAASQLMSLAICIPKVCTVDETISFVNDTLFNTVNTTITTDYCRLPNDKPLAPADYTAIAILSFIGLLLLASTSYDLYMHFVVKRDKGISPLYTSFSIYTNTRRILTFRSAPGALECIDGIRALSMFWVVIGHTYCMTLLGYIHNMRYTVAWMQKITSVWITSAPIVVDTFFLLSGVLAVYATVGKISKGRFIRTIHLFYLNRLLRIFPLLAIVVLLQASIFNHVSDGPYWMNVAHAAENCRAHWWSALLHVQNYVNPLTICLAHSWYLSVDTQLYILCPIVMFFLFGRERLAWCALVAIVLLSLVSSSLISFLNNFSAALANPDHISQFNQYVKYYYFNTLARAPPFFVGMVYGYLLHLCRNKKIRISPINVAILWLLAFAMMAFCIFSIHPVMQQGHEIQFFDKFLNSYMRCIWGVSLGWLIFACVHGYGGPINWFLSLSMWKLPARMSYAMYLVHLPIIMIANGNWVKTYYYSDGLNIYKFFGDICITFFVAFFLSVAVDAPCSTLQKMLMNAGKRPPRPQPKPTAPPIETTEDHYIKTAL